MLYNNLSGYLRTRYGKRLKKICIDAGFSCPNRDGTCGTGGCIFCGERGAGEHIDKNASIREQVAAALEGAKDGDEFIAYFQSFTNTYADVNALKERYDSALISEKIKILAIGTRPDCIDEEKARLIASYKDKYEVWVELGLQTANEETARLINRGYKNEIFEKAVEILTRYGIYVTVHLILGLPGEGLSDIKDTVSYLSRFKLFGIKIHSIYVMEGTKLAEMYRSGSYSPPSLDEYTGWAAWTLSHINPEIIIHRLTGDCPDGMLLAPEWGRNKHLVIEEIEKHLRESELRQGSMFELQN